LALFSFGAAIWNYDTPLETLKIPRGLLLIAGAWIALQSIVTLFQIAKKKASESRFKN
jgi:hypothetical protein